MVKATSWLGIMSRLEETGNEYERKDQTHLFEAIGESQKVVSSLQTKLCFYYLHHGEKRVRYFRISSRIHCFNASTICHCSNYRRTLAGTGESMSTLSLTDSELSFAFGPTCADTGVLGDCPSILRYLRSDCFAPKFWRRQLLPTADINQASSPMISNSDGLTIVCQWSSCPFQKEKKWRSSALQLQAVQNFALELYQEVAMVQRLFLY